MGLFAAWQLPKWRAFSSIAITFITIVFASAFALLALPEIAADFDITLRTVGWVIIIESLFIAALLLPLGGLADMFGDKRVLTVGIAIFGLGVVLTGLSPSFTALIGARIVTAFGNALVQSVATGLVFSMFPGNERGVAMGAQTSAVAVGSATAPLLGGLGLEFLSWNTVFLLIAIPSAMSLFAVRALIPDQALREVKSDKRFDVLGSVLSAATIATIVVTISNPFSLSFTSPGILGSAVAAVVLLTLFVRWELRISEPLLELRLFTERTFRTSVSLRTFGFLASAPTTLLLPIYLLSFREVSVVTAGIIIAAISTGMGIGGQIAGRLYDRLGPRMPSMVGFAVQTLTSLFFALADDETSLLLLGIVALVSGFALSLWNVTNNSALLTATPPAYLGVGGAFTNVARTLGSVIGQAAGTAIVASVMASRGFNIPLGDIAGNLAAGIAFNDGWQVVYLLGSGLSAALVLLATRLPGPERV